MVLLAFDDWVEPARMRRHCRRSRRIRLEVQRLPGDPALAVRLERALRGLPSVLDACASALTGRVLITYAGAPPLSLLEEEHPRASPGIRERLRGLLPRLRRTTTNEHRRRAPPDVEPRPWHALPLEDVLRHLETDEAGLSSQQATRRLARHGSNTADAPTDRGRLELVLSQFSNVPALLLIGSAGVALLLGDLADAATIIAVLVLNGTVGYVVERRNQDILASWRRLEAPHATVVRDGLQRELSAADLVPGDLLLLRAGDLVPADCRALESERLTCDEAALTGESEAQEKDSAPVAADAPLGERRSMLFSGTTVISGSGKAVVVATGRDTEVAGIGRLIEQARAPSAPLARRLEKLGARVAWTAAGSAAIVAVAGILHGRPLGSLVRATVALGVAAIPEGLPLVANAALVKSMQRLRDHGIVVRRLASAEALGGVTVVCADKTGTLTCNEMRLEAMEVDGREIDPRTLRARPESLFDDPPSIALAALLLNSDVEEHRRGGDVTLAGSSTEMALVRAAQAAGLDTASLRRRFPRVELRERREGVHFVVSVHDGLNSGSLAFIKGAPEQVVQRCERDGTGPLDESRRARVLARNEDFAGDGLRVLAVGWKRLRGVDDSTEDGFTLLGLVGLGDPIRQGAAEAVREMARAGIRTVMVTGDQRRTAEAIARRLGLEGEILTGEEIARLSEADHPASLARLDRAAAVARVAPADKLAIVRALQRRGEVVAMIGDGINDAPALKLADVGVAVGSGATDMARGVADLVLSGDDLRSILVAVGEGRGVHDNLHRSIRYLLATNFSELALMAAAAALGREEPLTPAQLLWINLMTDTLPGLALALEPAGTGVLERSPETSDASLLPPSLRRTVERDGLILGAAGALGNLVGGPPTTFAVLGALQIGYAALCRAPGRLLPGGHSDRRFAALVGAGAAMQGAAMTFAPLRSALRLPPPSASSLGFLAAALMLPYAVREIVASERIHRTGPGPRRPLEAALAPQELSP